MYDLFVDLTGYGEWMVQGINERVIKHDLEDLGLSKIKPGSCLPWRGSRFQGNQHFGFELVKF